MNKKVIALRGVSNVGKSDTVFQTYQLLTSKYKAVTSRHEKFGVVDIRIILTIKNIKIGIESRGDPSSRLPESLELFVNVGCKLIICATRTRGKTVDAVNELLKHGYGVIWLQQNVIVNASERERHLSNIEMAKKIVEEAEKIIGT